jgi:hypothetical protein
MICIIKLYKAQYNQINLCLELGIKGIRAFLLGRIMNKLKTNSGGLLIVVILII